MRCHTFGFQSINLEGMHRFHLNFTEACSIIKYRSSLIKVVIRKSLTELWPFLLRFWLNCQSVVSNQ